MADYLDGNHQIDELLNENHADKMLNWCNQGLAFIDEQVEREKMIKRCLKSARAKINSLESELRKKDELIERFHNEKSLELKSLQNEIHSLKSENKQLKCQLESRTKGTILKEKFDNLEKYASALKLNESVRGKKSPPRSPDENVCPEKIKKTKTGWITTDKEKTDAFPVSRRNSSLSLTKPAAKLKQTHLNFKSENQHEKKSQTLNETYCSEVENDLNFTSDSITSPSRFRDQKPLKVLDGLKETKFKKHTSESLFDSIELGLQQNEANIKEEKESQGMNTAVTNFDETLKPTVLRKNESNDSDVIILPTQKPEIFTIQDSFELSMMPLYKTDSKSSKILEEKIKSKDATPEKEEFQDDNWVPGHCRHCVEYYNRILPGGFDKNDPQVLPCNHELGRRLREDTPEMFWNHLFTPTQKK
uniref:CSON001480 protein n=1 Tax=Culicoides sonorensis TaxID=179676 RepID=A0A336KWV2_CULSO